MKHKKPTDSDINKQIDLINNQKFKWTPPPTGIVYIEGEDEDHGGETYINSDAIYESIIQQAINSGIFPKTTIADYRLITGGRGFICNRNPQHGYVFTGGIRGDVPLNDTNKTIFQVLFEVKNNIVTIEIESWQDKDN